MNFAVVRCPECLGSSQIEAGAVGQLVQCPHCTIAFEAVEVIEMKIPARAPRNPTMEAPQPERVSRGDRSDRPRRRRSRREREPVPTPEDDHDPHRHPAAPLPASVLIGLALLPFAIPVLWLVGPTLFGEPPVLSIATPIALAVSASILSLAVIYTIDWTPATRVKGVLMLVCVTYFAAMNLYFLKKEMVDKVTRVTGLDDRIEWHAIQRGKGKGEYEIKLPGWPKPNKGELLPQYHFEYFESSYRPPIIGQYLFTAGAARVSEENGRGNLKPGSDEWYDWARAMIGKRTAGGKLDYEQEITYQGIKGREFVFELEPGHSRVVRLFVIRGYVYFLSAEGPGIHPDEEPASDFFRSFNRTME